MGVRSMTVRRFDEIRRRLAEGRGLREIARALGCSRDTVREVRDGLRVSPDAPKTLPDPLWCCGSTGRHSPRRTRETATLCMKGTRTRYGVLISSFRYDARPISHYFGSFTASRSTCSICGG